MHNAEPTNPYPQPWVCSNIFYMIDMGKEADMVKICGTYSGTYSPPPALASHQAPTDTTSLDLNSSVCKGTVGPLQTLSVFLVGHVPVGKERGRVEEKSGP